MAHNNGPYYDLITTETIDQIFSFREIFFYSADFEGAFLQNPLTKMVNFDFIHSYIKDTF